MRQAAVVVRYRERAPEIRYLTPAQIDNQLTALQHKPQLQTKIAMLICARLQREERFWFTLADVELPKDHPGRIRVRAKTVNTEAWQLNTKCNHSVPVGSDLRDDLNNYTLRPSLGAWFSPSPARLRWDDGNFSADHREANPVRRTCLDYRNLFGSQLEQAGVSLNEIGHAKCKLSRNLQAPLRLAGNRIANRLHGLSTKGD